MVGLCVEQKIKMTGNTDVNIIMTSDEARELYWQLRLITIKPFIISELLDSIKPILYPNNA